MSENIYTTKNKLMNVILLSLLFIVIGLLISERFNSSTDPSFIQFYVWIGMMGISGVLASYLIAMTFKSTDYSLAFLDEDNDLTHPLSGKLRGYKQYLLGLLLALVFAISIIGFKSLIFPIPSVDNFATFSEVTFFSVGFIVPLLEDLFYLILMPNASRVILIGLLTYFGLVNDNNRKYWFALIVVLTSVFGALAFTSAHQDAYQDNTPLYYRAFIFSLSQIIIYYLTGAYFPIAHITNNVLAIISLDVSAGWFGVIVT